MKKSKATPALLKSGLALVLACSLMLPATAGVALADEAREGATPPPRDFS